MQPLTWNADRERVGENTFRTRIGVKWRNYLAEVWQPIDLSPREAGGLFTVSRAPYGLELPKLANDWAVIESTNRYDIWTRRRMPDVPAGIQKRYPDAAAVQGELTSRGILFAGAFPSLNADRLVQLHEQEVRDLIEFLSEPPGSGPVEVGIEIRPEGLPVLKSVGRGRIAEEADFRAALDIDQGLSFTTSRFRGVKIKAPRVWDSAGRSAPIKLRLRMVGGLLVGLKVIPRAFFARATFPVYADTTSTFYPDPDTESTTADGYTMRLVASEDFATIRAGNGNSADDAGTQALASISASGTTDYAAIVRGLTGFDIGGTVSGSDTVIAAELGLKGSAVIDFGSQELQIVEGTFASDTAVGNSDYQGNVSNTTELATGIALGSFNTSDYNPFTLNGTGLAFIETAADGDGIVRLCQRISGDRSNTDPVLGTSEEALAQWSSADAGGTTDDPYLEVVHANLTAYELDADVAAFTLTGQAAGLSRTRKVIAGTGAFSLSAQPAGLRATRKIVASIATIAVTANAAALVKSLPPLAANTGTFTLTGVAAGLLHGFEIAGATGVFSLTGNAATLTQTYPLVANTATFTLTGNAAGVYVGREVAASVATYTLTGVASTLTYTRAIRAVTAAFSETANAAGLRVARLIRAATGTFILTGNAVTMIAGYPITASVGAFALTGVAAGLRVTRYLAMATGSYSLTGVGASLEKGFKIVAAAGSFTETANAAALERGKAIVAATGEFTVSGQAASMLYQRRLAADAETFEVEAQDATLQAARLVVCAAGTFTQTGQAASLFVGRAIDADAAAFVETANDVTLKATRTMPAATGVFVETASDVSMRATHAPLAAAASVFSLTGNAAELRVVRAFVFGPATFDLLAQPARLAVGRSFAAAPAEFTFAGQSASMLARRYLVLHRGTFLMTANPAGLALVDGKGHAILAKISISPRIHAQISLEPRIRAQLSFAPRIKAKLVVSP